MRESTDFAYHLSRYFQNYLPGERGLTTNTILSYRDTFSKFLLYCKNEEHINPDKLTIDLITQDLVIRFLNHLEASGNSIATRNQRLATIRAFFDYLQYANPTHLYNVQQILSIKNKRQPKPTINYLNVDGMASLLAQPSLSSTYGYRDLVLLTLLYDSAARVSELIEIKAGDIRLDIPSTITLHGKGAKDRIVPLSLQTAELVKNYMIANQLNNAAASEKLLFLNHSKEKLTRAGVAYILKKYANQVLIHSPNLIPKNITPHCIRHSKAMHLLEAEVSLIYIRDFLGHQYLKTTEIYAKADGTAKRKALENAYKPTNIDSRIQENWNADQNLMEWLRSFV